MCGVPYVRARCVSYQVQMPDYLKSWENYCRLFDALLDCRDTNFVITEGWAFDLVHEFVYQFQSFCQLRGQVCVTCVRVCACARVRVLY